MAISYPSITAKSQGTKTGTSGYNVNPAPRSGVNAYGMVPGATALPQPFNDLAAVYPNLSGQTAQLSSNIMSELRGELSPETISNIQNNAAAFGVSSGMPGSGLARNFGLRNLGLESQRLQGQGLQDYLAAITGIKNTQTVSPESQIELSQSNAQLAAAPDPMMAAKEQERLFNEYLNTIRQQQTTGAGGPSRKGPTAETWIGDQLVYRYDPNSGFTKGPGAAAYYR